MKDLIFVGAGGFLLEVIEYMEPSIENSAVDVRIKGFLDDNLAKTHEGLTHLGSIDSYNIKDNDIFIITIGNVIHRSKIFDLLKSKGARFYTLIHESAYVSPSATIGEGSIVSPQSIVNALAYVGNNVAINVHCSVGHESRIGNSSVLSPFAVMNGNSELGAMNFLGTRSTIFPGRKLGDNCIVDSHAVVKVDVANGMIVTSKLDSVLIKNRLMR